MSSRFADGAGRLTGMAMRVFGWLPAQVWNLTPAELAQAFAPVGSGDSQTLTRAELLTLVESENHG